MTGETLEEQARQISAIEQEFSGWEARVSLDSWWHGRIKGAIRVMLHAESPEELREQIRRSPDAINLRQSCYANCIVT